MRIHTTVSVAKPRAHVWETVERPASSLLWLARPQGALEALAESDFASGAKHEFVEAEGDGRGGGRRWIVTVLLKQPSHGIDVSFDRGDLRLIVRQRLRARNEHQTAWTYRFEAYPARASAQLPALGLQGVAAWRIPRRMRRLRTDLERTRDRVLVAPATLGDDPVRQPREGASPAADPATGPATGPATSPTKGTMRIGPGFEGGA